MGYWDIGVLGIIQVGMYKLRFIQYTNTPALQRFNFRGNSMPGPLALDWIHYISRSFFSRLLRAC